MESFKYYLTFHHIFVFPKENISGFHILKKKSGHIEPTAGVNEATIWPKYAKMYYIPIQKHNQTQTQTHN